MSCLRCCTIYCYIVNFPKTLHLKTTNFIISVSVSQGHGNSGRGWLWPGVSHEFAVEISPGAPVSPEGLAWTGGLTYKVVPSHGCWRGVSVPYQGGLSTGPIECPHMMAAGFPHSE